MERKVISFIKTNRLLRKGATILVGVSGGPDSMALLHLLVAMRRSWDFTLIALTVDHQLRGEQSAEDVEYVKKMGKKWNVPVVEKNIDVKGYVKEEKTSKQVASRELRYAFYEEMMKKYNGDFLALGHHGDDQIETLLMAFTRVANASSLQGIPLSRPFATGEIVRPFLCVTKEEIAQYCRKNEIEPRFDPSNVDLADTRVFFRKKIIPLLREKNPNLHETAQHLSETFYEEHLYLQEEAKKHFKQIVKVSSKGKKATLPLGDYKKLAKPLQRRIFHLVLNYLYDGQVEELTYKHDDEFFSLIEEPEGTKGIHFPKGLSIVRSYEVVSFYFQSKKVDNELSQILAIPGTTNLPNGMTIVCEMTSEKEREEDQYTYYCSKEVVTLPLTVRYRQPGDRISWEGLQGRKKVSQLFIDEKVPKTKRDNWPLLVDGDGDVLWVIGLKKGRKMSEDEINSAPWIKIIKQGDE